MLFVRKPPNTAFIAPKGATAPAQQWREQEPLGVCRSRELLWITLTAAFNTHKNLMVEVRNSIKAFTSNRLGKRSDSVAPADKKRATHLPCLEKLAWLYFTRLEQRKPQFPVCGHR